MPLVTKQAIRREAADMVGVVEWGTATSGSTTFLADTETLQSSIRSPQEYVNTWIKLLDGDNNAGKVRTVDSYLRDQGRLNFEAPVTDAVAEGDTYEIYSVLGPETWDTCINRALRKLTKWRDIVVLPVATKTRYDLLVPATWLECEDDVVEVAVRCGDPSEVSDMTMTPRSWKVAQRDDHIYLYLTQPLGPGTAVSGDATAGIAPSGGRLLVAKAIGPFDALTLDSSTTSCPLDWIVAATLVEAYELYGKTIEQGVRGAVKINQQSAAANLTDQTERFAPKYSHPISEGW